MQSGNGIGGTWASAQTGSDIHAATDKPIHNDFIAPPLSQVFREPSAQITAHNPVQTIVTSHATEWVPEPIPIGRGNQSRLVPIR